VKLLRQDIATCKSLYKAEFTGNKTELLNAILIYPKLQSPGLCKTLALTQSLTGFIRPLEFLEYPWKKSWSWIIRHGVARRIFSLKFVLWCGNIENCRKIDHIFSATYQSLRPEETRPFGISSPKSRDQQRTRKLPKVYMGSGIYPVSTNHFAVIGIPPTARYARQTVSC
jgi:hypothetical protein